MGNVADFLPSRYGLPYLNRWPDVPDRTFTTPVGAFGVLHASNGLCGGMSFAARDLFEARRQLPTDTPNPAAGSPAFELLVNRLVDSWNIPEGVVRFFEWMNLPATDVPLLPRGIVSRTIDETMGELRSSIDAGHPCPIGIVCVHSIKIDDLKLNHQVLAWGYEDGNGTTIVRVYDPNHPRRDDVAITFTTTDPGHAQFQYSSGERIVLGFFTMDYQARDPTPLFENQA